MFNFFAVRLCTILKGQKVQIYIEAETILLNTFWSYKPQFNKKMSEF